jgi:hypothetical protein
MSDARLGGHDGADLSGADRELVENVERFGWSFMYVSPTKGDPEPQLFWGYTIGVYRTWGHPDLILFGPPVEAAHGILANAIELVASGKRLEPRVEYHEILANHRCQFLDVDPSWYGAFLGFAQWYYESADGFPVRQLVIPDKKGRYPWNIGYALPPGTQPLLVSNSEAERFGLA